MVADAITSNVKSDKTLVSIKLDNQEPISQQKETLNITNNNTTVKQLNTNNNNQQKPNNLYRILIMFNDLFWSEKIKVPDKDLFIVYTFLE